MTPAGDALVFGVRFVSPERGFVISEPPALVATRDGGATWEQVYPRTVLPATDWRGYQFFDGDNGVASDTVLDPGAILRTADGGRSWRQIGAITGRSVSALSFPDGRHGWALTCSQGGEGCVFYRTADGGGSWTPLPGTPWDANGDRLDAYAEFSFVDAQTGFVHVGRDQLYVTHDAGASFQQVRSRLYVTGPLRFISKERGWALSSGYLYATTDGGKTWMPVSLPHKVVYFDLPPDGRAWITADDCGGSQCHRVLLSTADGGKTLTRYDFGDFLPYTMRFADAAHGWMWGGSPERSLYRTEDGGQTWIQIR